MAYLSEKNGAFEQDITLQNQDLTITLPTNGKYLNKSIILNVSAQDGDVRIPSGTAIEAIPEIEIDSNGTITATINTAQNIAPTVYTDGWVDSNSISATNISVEGSNTYELGAKTSQDLTSNGATVYAPAGYYPLQAQKSIGNGTLQLTGGGLTAGSGNVSITSDGLYNAINGLNTVDQMEITATPPTGTDNYYQITVSGSGSVSRAAAYAQVTKNGYLSSSANKTIAADSISSNTQQTSYYILKATRNVTNGSISATDGSVTITPSGIITSQTDTGFGLTVEATGGSASIGASTVSVSAGYNPAPINAGTSTRNITGQTVTETKYIQAGAITASISSNNAGAASMSAHGLTPLASGTSDYYVQLSTTNGQVQATASTETEGYIKNASDVSDAVTVDVNGNGDKLYLAAATLGSEGNVTSDPMVTITNSTTMAIANTDTGYSFTIGNNVTKGTVQTKYKATTEGYTSVRTATNGGTVSVAPIVSGNTTVYIKSSTLSNTALNDVSYTDITDNSTILTSSGYLYINEGYTPNRMISLAHLIPDDANLSSSASMLEGVTAYDSNGVLYTGTIPIRTSEDILISGKSVTTAAGYYADAIVTSIGLGTITSPNSIATFSGPSYDSSTGKFTISAGGTIAEPTVNTAGYISTTEGTRNSGAISGSTTLNKIGLSTSHSGVTAAVTPVISKQTISINGVIDAAGGAATTTAPSSGVYVAVKSAANKGNLVSTPAVSSAGYGTTTNGQYSASTATSEVGANESRMTYIPITTTSASKSGASVTFGTGWITGNTITVDSGDYSATVSSHTISTNPVVSGKILGSINSITTSTKPSGADGVDYWVIIPNGEVTTTGYSTAVGEADIDTAGWINTGNKTQATPSTVSITPTINNGTTIYLPKVAFETSYIDAAMADVTVEPGTIHIDPNTANVTNKTRLDYAPTASTADINKYFIAVQATADANSNGSTAPVTGLMQASVAKPGYAPSSFKVNLTIDGTATSVTSAKTSDVYYIPIPTAAFTTTENKVYCNTAGYVPQGSTSNVVGTVNPGTVIASVSSNTSGSASMTATGFTALSGSNTSSYYVTLSTSAGSVKAKAAGGTAGYVTSSTTNETSATSVSVSGNGTKLYIPTTGVTASVSSNTAGSASIAATGFTASSSATSYYVTLSTSAGSVKAKAVGNGTGIITSSTTNETGATNVSVSGNGTKLYIPTTGITASVSSNTSGSASMAATGMTPLSSGTSSYYITLSTTAGSVKAKAVGNGTGIVTSSTSNETNATSVSVSGNNTKMYIPEATFANSATSGTTYTDKSSTAPVLIAGDYLYINKGYTPDIKISLAKLVPDGSDVKGHGEYIISGHTAYDNDGTLVAGTIPTLVASDITVSGKTVTIPLGKYTGASDGTAVSTSIADGAVTTSFAGDGISTYFNSGTSSDKNVTITPKYTNTAGYIAKHETATNNGGTAYYKIKTVSGSIGGSASGGSATAVIANTNSMATITDLSGKTAGTDYWQVKATATGSAGSYTPKYTVSTAGWIDSTVTGTAQSISVSSDSTGKSIYIPKATIAGSSTNATATTTVAPGTVSISKQSTPSGVTNAASGNATTTAPSSGVYVAVKATAAANSTGTTSNISGSGTATVTGAGYAPTSLTGSVTVSGTATAKTSAKDSSMTYVPITTATPAFDGGTLSGGSTATGTNVTLSTTDDNGIKVQTAYTAASTAVLYNGAVNGWVSKADNAQALAAQSKSSTNGTAYYVTAVTMPKDKGFTVTTTEDTALDTTSDLDVTNNAYRRVDITNKANGTVLIANSGTTAITNGSATAGTVTVNAYNNASTPALTGAKNVATNGKWVINNVTTSGTYYGMTVVPSTMVIPSGNIQLTQSTSTDVSAYATATVRSVTAAISGGGLSGTATATGSSCAISDNTNSSGVSITTACTASRAKVSCTASTAGWASGTIKELAAGTGTMTAKTYYINGVTITAPTSGTRSFTITVPNGSANDNVTFTFNVDSSYNVTIT